MRNKYMLIGVIGIIVGVLLSSAVFVLAGNPDSPSAPGATNSYTLDDIYNRLDTGAAATQSTFTEPAAGPGTGTMHTLDEIYALIGLRAQVPKTGQTTSYATGDDGNLQKGVTWPAPRFTDNLDGTVTDNLTGLIWLKNANCFGTKKWQDGATYPALEAANTLNSGECGLTDGSVEGAWRLPNVREMQSLVHYGVYNPAVPDTAGTGKWSEGQPFTGVQSNVYWSSTTDASGTGRAWYVALSDGSVYRDGKAYDKYVWPVRGGQ